MNRILLSVGAAMYVLASGCSDDVAPSPAPMPPEPPAPSASEPTEVELVAWMEAHYGATIRAHDALMHGDLPAFRGQLEDASRLGSPTAMPEPWAPLLDRFRAAARDGASAANLDDAASAIASVVVTCGQCHVALARGPVYPAPAPDDAINAFQAAMFDHKWATERLWEGVTGPWDLAWERGAAALVETPVFGDALGELEGDLLRCEQEMKALGEAAQGATGHAERAAIYGRMLATCGDCHDAAGVRFEEAP